MPFSLLWKIRAQFAGALAPQGEGQVCAEKRTSNEARARFQKNELQKKKQKTLMANYDQLWRNLLQAFQRSKCIGVFVLAAKRKQYICSVKFIYLVDQEKIFCIGKDLIWNVFFLVEISNMCNSFGKYSYDIL